jgi:hypothetical protein
MNAEDAKRQLTFEQFARLVLDAVEAAELDYLIGGAVAVWAYAEPRTTRDFDVVVNLPGNRIRRFSEELVKRDMLVPPEVILDLLLQPEGDLPINAIHLYTGLKADIFLQRMGDDYRAMTLARRRSVDLGSTIGTTYVHAPEDLILNKVHYFSISGQEKHIRDIAAIQAYRGDQLDWPYLHFWLGQLGLQPMWDEVQAAVDKLLG